VKRTLEPILWWAKKKGIPSFRENSEELDAGLTFLLERSLESTDAPKHCPPDGAMPERQD